MYAKSGHDLRALNRVVVVEYSNTGWGAFVGVSLLGYATDTVML